MITTILKSSNVLNFFKLFRKSVVKLLPVITMGGNIINCLQTEMLFFIYLAVIYFQQI